MFPDLPLSLFDWLLFLLFLFVLLIPTLMHLVVLWLAVKTHRDVLRSKPVDISHLETQPPSQAQPLVVALGGMGFRRLGEWQTQIPGQPPAIEWVFVNPEGDANAGIALAGPKGVLGGFVSMFGDDSVLETDYPVGENINDPDFHCHTVKENIRAAYEYHRQQIAPFALVHGDPRRIESPEDWQLRNDIYRARYSRRKLRPLLWRQAIIPLASDGYGLLVLLAGLAARFIFRLPLLAVLIGVLLCGLLPSLAVDVWIWRRLSASVAFMKGETR